MLKIEIKKLVISDIKGKRTQYYFHIKASNGQILCHSENYTRKANALSAIDCIVVGLSDNRGYKVVDMTADVVKKKGSAKSSFSRISKRRIGKGIQNILDKRKRCGKLKIKF